MSNITSVSTEIEHPRKALAVLFIIAGLILFVFGIAQGSAALGFAEGVLALFGYFGYRGIKPIWHLRIVNSSGETTPLRSVNGEWISSIVQAINEAIIHRA